MRPDERLDARSLSRARRVPGSSPVSTRHPPPSSWTSSEARRNIEAGEGVLVGAVGRISRNRRSARGGWSARVSKHVRARRSTRIRKDACRQSRPLQAHHPQQSSVTFGFSARAAPRRRRPTPTRSRREVIRRTPDNRRHAHRPRRRAILPRKGRGRFRPRPPCVPTRHPPSTRRRASRSPRPIKCSGTNPSSVHLAGETKRPSRDSARTSSNASAGALCSAKSPRRLLLVGGAKQLKRRPRPASGAAAVPRRPYSHRGQSTSSALATVVSDPSATASAPSVLGRRVSPPPSSRRLLRHRLVIRSSTRVTQRRCSHMGS